MSWRTGRELRTRIGLERSDELYFPNNFLDAISIQEKKESIFQYQSLGAWVKSCIGIYGLKWESDEELIELIKKHNMRFISFMNDKDDTIFLTIDGKRVGHYRVDINIGYRWRIKTEHDLEYKSSKPEQGTNGKINQTRN